jgi:hypothetical protein
VCFLCGVLQSRSPPRLPCVRVRAGLLGAALCSLALALIAAMLPLARFTMGGIAGEVEGTGTVTDIYLLTLPLGLPASTDSRTLSQLTLP